ncbi:hypothetical protein [Bosea sp. (in: a-proteobacteria)]|uniref:hypothetical protein n=1 Tax=Bosea sp. (in: a-proteobacteria) TaxID=1871050 RepID=UPI002636D678|nr:hypothetical protein [Bosea sp. (in: a-proteobacteria)]MCO5092861.1 hypothetical protein [Bosea sp. (in: a-proteobacteria)]
MKHTHQMSLIARRAQIRRAAAQRKELVSAERLLLRLVASAGDEAGQPSRHDRREAAPAADPPVTRQRPFSQ